jgi:hypothetical protein
LSIVGSLEIFQQTPLDITGAPPSAVILPPETAVVVEISVAVVVDKEGGKGFFSQEGVKITIRNIPKTLDSFFMNKN